MEKPQRRRRCRGHYGKTVYLIAEQIEMLAFWYFNDDYMCSETWLFWKFEETCDNL